MCLCQSCQPSPRLCTSKSHGISQGLLQGVWRLLCSFLLCCGCNIPRKTPAKVCVSANQGKAAGEEELKESCSSQKAALKEGTELG